MYFKKLLITAFILSSFSIFTAEYNNINFSIRYFDKKIYYPGDDVQLKASIINNSAENYRFNLSENRIFNITLNVKTLNNRLLEPSEKLIINSNRNGNTFYREIIIGPGEEFSFIVDLDEYTDINRAGMYIIEGMFTANLNNPGDSLLVSNRLPLSVRPSTNNNDFREILDYETGEILRANPIPPDEVIKYIIEARQKSIWSQFFLYIDLKELMLNNSDLKRRFERSTEEEQQLLIENFRNEMEGLRLQSDQSIVIIPSAFEILHTTYSSENATVIVREEFQQNGFTAVKSFTYFLHKKDGIWKVYNYEIKNIGTK